MSVPLTEAEILEILSQNTELRRQLQERVLQLSEQTRTNETILETIRGHMNVQESKLKAAERLNGEYRRAIELMRDTPHHLRQIEIANRVLCEHEFRDYQCEKCGKSQEAEKRVEPVKYCMCQPPSTATIKKHREDCHLYGA